MKRSPLHRKSPLRSRPKPRKNSEQAEAWRRAVLQSRPALTADRDDPGWPVDCHHIILAQRLRRYAREHGISEQLLVHDPRVAVPVTRRRHERIHSGHQPLLAHEVPREGYLFARELGLLHLLPAEET